MRGPRAHFGRNRVSKDAALSRHRGQPSPVVGSTADRGPRRIDRFYWFSSSWTFGSLKLSLVTTCAGISTTRGSTFSPFSTLSIAWTPR
jgi:hypothetical protein